MKKSFIVLPALAMLFLFQAACSQMETREAKSDDLPNAKSVAMVDQPVQEDIPALTSIEFAETSFNFGEKKITDDFTHTFTFTNTGENDLVIESAKASCSCTVSEYTKGAIKPGETGTISAKFNPKEGYTGTFKKTVTVTANVEPKNMVLEITGEVVN